MTDDILSADTLVVERGDQRVLDGVSLEIPPAARVLIRGTSGAGKTTLFRVLGLLEPPTTGEVYVDGTAVGSASERTRARIRRTQVGTVFQDFQLISDLTVRENTLVPQQHRRRRNREPEWVDTLLERLGLDDQADAYPATLSGGEKQRVAIARALANRPAVVLADEPTGQLDPNTAASVLELLVELQQETDIALVVVSHDIALGDRFNRQIELADGRITETTTE
ncbi:ABC transporter ATP-binding protein [Halosegnis longus]|uniref:ABC transporter ATP-binding protein n=1 Tax=Halosegnis longus TaxID=2216012 RepID=UPI00096A55EC